MVQGGIQTWELCMRNLPAGDGPALLQGRSRGCSPAHLLLLEAALALADALLQLHDGHLADLDLLQRLKNSTPPPPP